MSCCSGGYCNFKFPEGPPLVDNAVANLEAKYQFLPYGTLLQKGETVRIWMEGGQTKTVFIEDKVPLNITPSGPQPQSPELLNIQEPLPWQLIAFDSGFAYQDLQNWSQHPLHNPNEQAILLVYNHPIEVKPSLKARWLGLLYKIRNLGN